MQSNSEIDNLLITKKHLETMSKKEVLTRMIQTDLPVFNGFYNTIFGSIIEDIEGQDDDELTSEELDLRIDSLDYKAIEKDLAILACEFIEQEMSEFVSSVKFLQVHSPRYSNFSNDTIACEVVYNVDAIREFVYNHKDDFEIFLSERFTSYDGFLSYYSNRFEVWESDSEGFTDLDCEEVHFQSVLNFIAQSVMDDARIDMYYYMSENRDGYYIKTATEVA